MSIVRVGLAETKNFSEGYDLIFGKKKETDEQAAKKDETSSTQQPQQPQPKKES
jgi:hypothetical protein